MSSLTTSRAGDREHLLERLHNLRTILPVFAQELAGGRRQAARLRVENGRLAEEVRRLQRSHGASRTAGAPAPTAIPGTLAGEETTSRRAVAR